MKILITGGAGFVGKNLIRAMKEVGFNPVDITVIDKNEANLNFVKNLGVTAVLADLSLPGQWGDNFDHQDLVITLQAQISGSQYDLFRKNNVDATQNVIAAAKKFGVKKIIHFSSAAVLSVRQDFYATTKKAGDELVKNSRLSYVILQPSLMYGPLDDKNIGWLINFAKKCPIFPIPGNGQYPRQPIYIDDMSHLVIEFIKNFPSENEATRNEIARGSSGARPQPSIEVGQSYRAPSLDQSRGLTEIRSAKAGRVYSINGQQIINFREIISTVLKNMGGLRLAIYLPLPIFLFLLRIYDILFKSPFTPDQIKSLTSGDVFPEYPWWDEFKIEMTSFDQGVKNMLIK